MLSSEEMAFLDRNLDKLIAALVVVLLIIGFFGVVFSIMWYEYWGKK